jgi:hypothetical protein
MKEKIYAELCNNYRYFLNWRHAAFAGNLAAIGGTLFMVFSVGKNIPDIAFLIPLFASPIGIVLWLLDIKIRRIYRSIYEAGRELEGDYPGYFKQLPLIRSTRITHSKVLTVVYWLSTIGLLVFSVFLYYCGL